MGGNKTISGEWELNSFQVGFIGVGNMGFSMARRLLQAGITVMAFDKSRSNLDRIAEIGGLTSHSLEELANCCDPIITSLPSSAIVEEVIVGQEGLIHHMAPGTCVIEMTTADPLSTLMIAEKLQHQGIRMLDAPVTGGPYGCDAGTLSVMVGGAPETFEAYKAILSAIGPKNLNYTGPVGSGHIMKMINNLFAGTGRLAATEATLLAAKFGMEPEKTVEVLNKSHGRNFFTEVLWPNAILKGTTKANFTLELMAKDVGLSVSLGEKLQIPLFLAGVVQHFYEHALLYLGKDTDANELVYALEEKVGVNLRASTSLTKS